LLNVNTFSRSRRYLWITYTELRLSLSKCVFCQGQRSSLNNSQLEYCHCVALFVFWIIELFEDHFHFAANSPVALGHPATILHDHTHCAVNTPFVPDHPYLTGTIPHDHTRCAVNTPVVPDHPYLTGTIIHDDTHCAVNTPFVPDHPYPTGTIPHDHTYCAVNIYCVFDLFLRHVEPRCIFKITLLPQKNLFGIVFLTISLYVYNFTVTSCRTSIHITEIGWGLWSELCVWNMTYFLLDFLTCFALLFEIYQRSPKKLL